MIPRWLDAAGGWCVCSMAASSEARPAARSGAILRLPLSWRVAGRELRGGIGGFRLFLFCLALGVALIAGVGSVADAVRVGLSRDARMLLGGDLEIRLLYRPATPVQLRAFADAGEVSAVDSLRAMARSVGSRREVVEMKAAAGPYPLIGEMTLAPPMPLAAALEKRNGVWGAVADAGVLDRLGVRPGDRVTVGKLSYELRAVIAREPDRGAGAFLLGPRLMVARESIGDTGLIQPGSLIYHLYRIAYRPGLDDKAFRADLDRRFPDAGWRMRGIEDASPGVKRFIDRTALFLTLVGLSALLIGGV